MIRDDKGKIDGLKVTIIGDIAHSRVARSNIYGLTKMGARVHLCGPSTMMPSQIGKLGVQVTHRAEEAIEGADVIMMLRIQLERQSNILLPSAREYMRFFGLTPARMDLAKPDAIIMHPGPMNRGVEITSEVADSPRSRILSQVTNGVAVRMALLFLLAGGGEP